MSATFYKLLPWLLLLIGGIVVYLFWPQPKAPDYSVHEARIKQRDSAFHQLSRKYTKLEAKMNADSVSHKIEIQTYKDRDKIKSREIANLKANPTIVKVRSEVPAIDTLIQAYDSLLQSKDEQIELQAKYIETLQVDVGKVTENFMERLALQDSTIQDQKSIIEDQRKTIRKERRQKRLAKILIPAAVVLGFLVGNQI